MTEPLIDEWINVSEGEPRFGLRGHDEDAPATILFWVERRRARLAKLKQTDKVKKELRQCTEAEAIAWRMQDFQKGHEETPVETMREDQKTAHHHATRVDNAVAESTEALNYVISLDRNVPPHFAHSIKHLKRLAEHLRELHRKSS